MVHRVLSWVVICLCFGLLASSCESFSAYCEESTDCMDGNDLDVEACVASREASSDRASLYGCSEWFDNLQECLELESDCENDFYTPDDNCEDEARDLNSCMSD